MTFVVGAAAGAGALYAVMPPPVTVVQRVERVIPADQQRLLRQAYYPLRFDFASLAPRSPSGKLPDQVAPPSQPDRASRFYKESTRNAALTGKPTPESIYWLKQAVRLCEREPIHDLGAALWEGEGGVQKDRLTGFQLMRFAAGLGSSQARTYIMNVIRSNLVDDMPTANVEWYRVP